MWSQVAGPNGHQCGWPGPWSNAQGWGGDVNLVRGIVGGITLDQAQPTIRVWSSLHYMDVGVARLGPLAMQGLAPQL